MKQRKYEARSNLIRLCDQFGIQFQEYGRGNHFRLFGGVVVDYWPGTSRAWKTGSLFKGEKMDAGDVVVWVKTGIKP